MLRIGITGGIGSGKTTVARIFGVLGVPVYYADNAAKAMMNKDEGLKKQIVEMFGPAAYENGILNRNHLASIVFNDPVKLAKLNAIIHPATIADAEKWMKEQSRNALMTPAYALKEAALIFESGAQDSLDYVIGVHAPYELRLQRAMQRDSLSREAVEARMAKQMDESEKMRLCHFIISNNEEEMLIPQVVSLHEKLLQLSAKGQVFTD